MREASNSKFKCSAKDHRLGRVACPRSCSCPLLLSTGSSRKGGGKPTLLTCDPSQGSSKQSHASRFGFTHHALFRRAVLHPSHTSHLRDAARSATTSDRVQDQGRVPQPRTVNRRREPAPGHCVRCS